MARQFQEPSASAPAAFEESPPSVAIVLQTSIQQIEEQQTHLSTALEGLQKSDYHSVDRKSHITGDEAKSSIDHIITAWRSMNQTYFGIFSTLAESSKFESEQSPEARATHQQFARMAYNALQSKNAIDEGVLAMRANGSLRSGENDDATTSTEETSMTLGRRQEKTKAKRNRENGTTLNKTGGGIEKSEKARHSDRRHKQRMKKIAGLVEQARLTENSNGDHEGTSNQARDRPRDNANGVAEASDVPEKIEFEDLSAEVEERLKSKAAKKEAAKKEKKRKRESGESIPDEEVKAVKPVQKRAKSVNEADPKIESKKHRREEVEPAETRSSKRKKQDRPQL